MSEQGQSLTAVDYDYGGQYQTTSYGAQGGMGGGGFVNQYGSQGGSQSSPGSGSKVSLTVVCTERNYTLLTI
jgi:hypothetical protein